MLRASQSLNAEASAKYFTEVLSKGDYYVADAAIKGRWRGALTERLGFTAGSVVTPAAFKRLLSGLHPFTGEKLVQRLAKNRRPGVDLTFSVPKSISLAWAITKDEAILDALRECVAETMQRDVEPLVCRRVRDGEKVNTTDRKTTGEFIYADFLHFTSRPTEGRVDAHLHIHAFVMNLTHDDGKIYAAELEEIFRQRPALQAAFHARLARRMEELGYRVEKTRYQQSGRMKSGWELAGILRATIEKFSTRTQEIEEHALRHGINDADEKGALGARLRDKKAEGATIPELRQGWRDRLTPAELAAFAALKDHGQSGQEDLATRVQASLRYALDHHLYRQSTVETHLILQTALEHGLTLSPEQVAAGLGECDAIRRTKDVRGAPREFITTAEVLAAETRLIEYARDGRGTRMKIGRHAHRFTREWLNADQKAAVRHVLESRDAVTAITGGAGTGKTSMMQEAADAIRQNGKEPFMFAPSTGAREVLQEKGFDAAQTVEHLIRNTSLHPELKDQVIWIDEAGLIDVRSMNAVFDIARQQNARVVLSGDSRQHQSPRAGAALQMLENEAGLQAARIETIQRQRGQYKRAVELISLGATVIDKRSGTTGLVAGFDLLDRLGKIHQIAGEDRYAVLADKYLAATSGKKQQSTLVVSPTHAEGQRVTAEIRDRLREAGAVGKETRGYRTLRSLNLSDAEKGQRASFDGPDTVVQFHQNVAGGYRRGERYRVAPHERFGLGLEPVGGGEVKPIPHDHADRFEVYREDSIGLAVGDKVRFSLGGRSADGGRQISNGRLDRIERITPAGDLVLKSGMTVAKDYGHLDLGYCITSHAAQGADADKILCAMGSESLPAVSSRQFYVSVSRGREDIAIYVDDKAAVRRAIQDAGDRMTATELVRVEPSKTHSSPVERSHERRAFFERVRSWWRSRPQASAPAIGVERAATTAFNHQVPERGMS
jgi:conjugative relaxase-like TrwC/TraI family protein